jgi:hypothetical protein
VKNSNIFTCTENFGFQVITFCALGGAANSSSNLDQRINNLDRVCQINAESITRLDDSIKLAVVENKK